MSALLPDYSFKDEESVVGTSVSGIIGCIVTITFLLTVGYVIKLKRKKENVINE